MMKTKLILVSLALTFAQLSAETLTTDTAVFAQTDAKSPVLARLKSGTTVNVVGEAPAGWRRIELTGPVEAYVHNRDITKGLEVREGATILAAPSKDAQILTVAAPGDKVDIVGLHGDYCQIKLDKKIQAFISTTAAANTPATSAPTPAAPAAPSGPVTTPGRPVQMSGDNSAMPRMFAGRLVTAKRAIINPNPLYDFQLMDASGRRFAYVDTKRLLLTDKIEAYLDRNIAITGTIRNTVDGKDLVIAAESMQLK
jgi:SH3 domain-containing protein